MDYIDRRDLDGWGYNIDHKELDPRQQDEEWQARWPVRGTTIFWVCNYHQRFFLKCSQTVEPLSMLTKKDEPWQWESEKQCTFETMVTAFTTAPVVQHLDHERQVIIETDVPDYISARVMAQYDNQGVLHYVSEYLKKHTPAECNYDIYHTDIMASNKELEEWRPECEGAAYPLQLSMDHTNLDYVMTKMVLHRRQARWSECLTQFDYQIVYWGGKSNSKRMLWRGGHVTSLSGAMKD